MADVVAKGPVTSLQGWRTWLINGGIAVALTAVAYVQLHGTEIIDPKVWPFIAIAINAVNVWLRNITTGPVKQGPTNV